MLAKIEIDRSELETRALNFRIDVARVWHGLLCEPQRETVAADGLLTRLRLSVYLPRYIQRVASGNGRRQPVLRLVVRGYLFMPASIGFQVPWAHIRATPGIRGRGYVADTDGKPATITDTEIERLREHEAYMNQPVPVILPYAGSVGDKVRVVDGPFSGFSGVVVEIAKDGRISVEIDLFGRPTPVDMLASSVEPI